MYTSQPASSGYSSISIFTGQTPALSGSDECLTPASGHYGPRSMQVSQSGSNEVTARIPNLLHDSGQVCSDGTYSSYANAGSSGGEDAQALLSFDISSIPEDASIRSTSLQFEGWDMVGTPFSKLGCLNILPTSYRMLGSNSYSSATITPPCLKVYSSADMSSLLSSPGLTSALQSSLGQEKFQLRLQFEGGAEGLTSQVISRVYTIDGSGSSYGEAYPSSGLEGSYTPGADSIYSYLSSGSSSDQETMRDMGLDWSFLQSDDPETGYGSHPGHVLSPPGFNLTELGITPEMLEKAVDPGRVRVTNLEEGAPCSEGGKSGIWHSDGSFWICDTSVDSEACPGPGDSGSEGSVIGTSHIGWISRDPYTRSQPQRSCDLIKIGVAWLIVTYSLPPSCDPFSCQAQSKPIGQPSSRGGSMYQIFSDCNCIEGTCQCDNIEKDIGPAPCDQASCQAQSKPTGQPYAREGRLHQAFSDCSCAGGDCRCISKEKDIGPAPCDQASCQARSRAIGSAYSRDGKIYQEVQECSCIEGACRCARVEKLVGIDARSRLLPPPSLILPQGNVTFKKPEASSIIDTSRWGQVPVNQILVEVRNGTDIADLERIVESIGGQIVGYDESIDLYQIETSGKTEADLIDAISKAEADVDVALAFPDQEVYLFQSPLIDPIYGGNLRGSYDIAGVEEAWSLIRSSNLSLNEVRVGVTDDGLYRGFGEFNDTDRIVTKVDAELKSPLKDREHCPWAGSHGTGVMNIIAADPGNGGLVGIASEALGSKLKVYMYNFTSPEYEYYVKGGPYSQALYTLNEAVGMEARILSISWGKTDADEKLVQNYQRKVSSWAEDNPSILLVCAVPNAVNPMDKRENRSMDIRRCIAGGPDLPNVITVGSIMNNGSLLSSCWGSQNYQVTLAAPGEEAIYYQDDASAYKNARHFGGTSMAVPMVTSAAAIIRSLDEGLNASEIKTILMETGRTSINVSGKQVPVPAELGGRVLAIDLAVKRVIEDRTNGTLRQ